MSPTTSSTHAVELAARLRLSIARLSRLLRQEAGTGLSPTQLAILASVDSHGSLTLGELAAIEQVAAPTITKAVGKLEEEGYLSRSPDASDRRVARVAITAHGSRLLETSRTRRNAWLARQLAELTADDVARLAAAADVLEKLSRQP